MKIKHTVTLNELNRENRLITHMLLKNTKYFDHTQFHCGLDRTVMDGMASVKQGGDRQEEDGFTMLKYL
jgi:hypothetical protein